MAYVKKTTLEKCTKGCINLIPIKGDNGIAINYRNITFTAIVTKFYDILHNHIRLEIEKFFGEIRASFGEIDS